MSQSTVPRRQLCVAPSSSVVERAADVAPVCSGSAVAEELWRAQGTFCCRVSQGWCDKEHVCGVSGGGGGREEGGQVCPHCHLPGGDGRQDSEKCGWPHGRLSCEWGPKYRRGRQCGRPPPLLLHWRSSLCPSFTSFSSSATLGSGWLQGWPQEKAQVFFHLCEPNNACCKYRNIYILEV